jgi:hypothetical protein
MAVAIPGNIVSGVTIAGVVGTFDAGSTCTSDGETSCTTTGSFPAAALPSASEIASGSTIAGVAGTYTGAAPNAWDLRYGVTVGGVTGALPVDCRNQASTNLYTIGTPQAVSSVSGNTLTITNHGYSSNQTVRVDYTSAGGLSTGVTYYVIVVDANDIQLSTTSGPGSAVTLSSPTNVSVFAYNTGSINTASTIDDNYNYSGSGKTYTNPWTAANLCGGSTTSATDAHVWLDVTTTAGDAPSTCAGTPANCTYEDKISHLSWTKTQSTGSNWAAAMETCANLTYNNQTGWRLPTQKELMNAYEHGINTATNANWITSADAGNSFWSSSTYSVSTAAAWGVNLATGNTNSLIMPNSLRVACVR